MLHLRHIVQVTPLTVIYFVTCVDLVVQNNSHYKVGKHQELVAGLYSLYQSRWHWYFNLTRIYVSGGYVIVEGKGLGEDLDLKGRLYMWLVPQHA